MNNENIPYQRVLIVAPHIDDETIGCYSWFRRPNTHIDVLWLYEKSPTRLVEGNRLLQFQSEVGVQLQVNALAKSVTEAEAIRDLELSRYTEVLVPSLRDNHAAHKKASRDWRIWATLFYSVDMVNGIPLPQESALAKRELLDRFYPSQKMLWALDAKYYLFESIHKRDYDAFVHFEHSGVTWKVNPDDLKALQDTLRRLPANSLLERRFNTVLQYMQHPISATSLTESYSSC